MTNQKGNKICLCSVFYEVIKRTKNRQQTKTKLRLARRRCRSRKSIFGPSKCFRNAKNVVYDFSLMILGKELTNKEKKGAMIIRITLVFFENIYFQTPLATK